MSAGWFHSCAVVDGGARCWGHDGAGQLGDGRSYDVDLYGHPCPGSDPCGDILPAKPSSALPVAAIGLDDVTSVSAGAYHTCALAAGGISCFGSAALVEVGYSPAAAFGATAVEVTGVTSGMTEVGAGSDHTCAVDAGGAVRCWGTNFFGELGDGTSADSPTPVDVAGLSGSARSVATGFYHTCAVTTDGAAMCWGPNGSGQLGDGTTADRSSPVQVAGLDGTAVAIANGQYHTCAVSSAGGVKCWGDNSSGQLGSDDASGSSRPVDVVGLTDEIVGIAAGGYHSCALSARGTVQCWGVNNFYQLGDGTGIDSSTPVDVGEIPGLVVAIDAGYDQTCALTDDGEVWCWGDNAFGQLGDGSTALRPLPVRALLDGEVASDPQGVVQSFYDSYLSEFQTGVPDLHGRPDVTPEFIDWFYGDQRPFDPIVCAQGLPTWALARPAAIKGSLATVHVATSFAPDAEGVPVDLVLGPTGWQIAAIRCGE